MLNPEKKRFLVEMWEKDSGHGRERFLGNGGVVVKPDGRRCVVTAKHVVFDGSRHRDVIIKGNESVLGKSELDTEFAARHEQDVAEAILHDGDGLFLSNVARTDKELSIVGTRFGAFDHTILVEARYIGGKRIDEVQDEDGLANLTGEVIHYDVVGGDSNIVCGTSGSMIFDSDQNVVGINTCRKNPSGTKGLGWIVYQSDR